MVLLRNATICQMFHSPVDSHGCVSWKSGLTWRVPVWRIPVWRVPGQILELYGDSKIQLDDLFLGCLSVSPIEIITSQVSMPMSIRQQHQPIIHFSTYLFKIFFVLQSSFKSFGCSPLLWSWYKEQLHAFRHAGMLGSPRDVYCVKDCNFHWFLSQLLASRGDAPGRKLTSRLQRTFFKNHPETIFK